MATKKGQGSSRNGRDSNAQRLGIKKHDGNVVTGTPVVTGARVVGIVEGEARGPKIRVFKKKRRKGMRRTKGHRSTFTLVRITEIQA